MVVREVEVSDEHSGTLGDLASSHTLVCLPFWLLPNRVQSDNAMALTYLNHQWEARSPAAQEDAYLILS